jgi:protocatechuate 4,5-dioxygenase beta chain
MLTLGIGASHAPAILLPVDVWPKTYQVMRRNVGQPESAALENAETNAAAKARIDSAIARLREVVRAAKPDVLLIVGDDQQEVFGAAFNPTLAVYCGTEVSGRTIPVFPESGGDHAVELKCAAEFASALAAGLIDAGFDPAVMTELVPLSRPDGIGHAFTRPGYFLGLADLGIPIVPLFLNTYHPPLPSGERCYELGVAIRKIADARPEKVAVLGSGGLSHDPGGPRAGWIDRELDTWVLRKLSEGNGDELAKLFAFDSEMFHGGTGEVRSWIAVAGAFASVPAEVVDYIPLHHAVTGLGFAYWQRPAEVEGQHRDGEPTLAFREAKISQPASNRA